MNRELGVRKSKYRVFLVDDHPIVRYGLVKLITPEPDLMVCGESEEESKAVPAITAAKPDLVVAALNLRRSSGIFLIKHLNALDPKVPILVLSIHEESLYAQRCLRAGARGYLMKEEATEKVLLAMRRILAGQVYLSEAMQSKMFRASGKQNASVVTSPLERLSDRELEVYRLIGQAVGTREIAKLLHVSISTVESHRARIKEKLGLRSATELFQHAVKCVETESLG